MWPTWRRRHLLANQSTDRARAGQPGIDRTCRLCAACSFDAIWLVGCVLAFTSRAGHITDQYQIFNRKHHEFRSTSLTVDVRSPRRTTHSNCLQPFYCCSPNSQPPLFVHKCDGRVCASSKTSDHQSVPLPFPPHLLSVSVPRTFRLHQPSALPVKSDPYMFLCSTHAPVGRRVCSSSIAQLTGLLS